MVIKGELPKKLKTDAEMYAGCVSGASSIDEYLEIIKRSGFSNISVHKQQKIEIPVNILRNYLDESEIKSFKLDDIGIFSITVSGKKSNC